VYKFAANDDPCKIPAVKELQIAILPIGRFLRLI